MNSGHATDGGTDAQHDDAEYSGIVRTRNHFETTGPIRPFLGVELKDEHTRTGFDIRGTIPGLSTERPPDELAVFVHGFNTTASEARETFEEATTAMRDNGYDHPVVGYSWDSLGDVRWYQAVDIAWRNGPKFADFLRKYKQKQPATPIRIVAHSLGSQVTLAALETLQRADLPGIRTNRWNHCVDSVSLIGAAVDRRAPRVEGSMYTSLGNYYTQSEDPALGPIIEDVVDRFHNYYSNDDEVLNKYFKAAEWTSALGQYGAKEPDWTAFNFFDYDVTDAVASHSHYYKPGKGCMGQVVDDWTYAPHRFQVVNVNSELSLALDHDSPNDNVNIVQHETDYTQEDPDPEDWKYWRIDRLGNGEFRLAVVETDKVFDVSHPFDDAGSNVHQWHWHGRDNQRWYVEHDGDGKYHLRSKESELLAEVEGRSTEDGANVRQWDDTGNDNQYWWLLRYRNEYRVRNEHSGMVLDVSGSSTDDGANVQQWGWHGQRNQRWRVEYLRDREYRIINVNSGKVLDVAGRSTKNGANVHQWEWTGNDNQRWYVQDVGNGECRIVNKNSGKVLDVSGGHTSEGTNVQQWKWGNQANQRFRFKSA